MRFEDFDGENSSRDPATSKQLPVSGNSDISRDAFVPKPASYFSAAFDSLLTAVNLLEVPS